MKRLFPAQSCPTYSLCWAEVGRRIKGEAGGIGWSDWQQGNRTHSPRPEPWGSSDQVCSSKPQPKVRSSCSLSGSLEWTLTIPAQMKAAFSRAPAEGPA